MSWKGDSKRHSLSARGIENKYTKLYHGTSVDSLPKIKKEGIRSPYVTTSPYSAEYFGQYHGEPRIVEIQVPEDKLYWADDSGNIKEKAYIKDLENERYNPETGKPRDDYERLIVKGYVKPKQIRPLSKEKQTRKVEKEKMKW